MTKFNKTKLKHTNIALQEAPAMLELSANEIAAVSGGYIIVTGHHPGDVYTPILIPFPIRRLPG